MKTTAILFSAILISIWACSGTQKTVVSANEKQPSVKTNDTVRIANDSLEYEVIVIDAGFNTWLASRAQPRNYYSQSYLEARNVRWVTEWNMRVRQPFQYSRDMYAMEIDYRLGINYGYEVNYLLYNYLTYFQLTNNQKLGGFVPRI